MHRRTWRFLMLVLMTGLVLYGCSAGRKRGGSPAVADILYHGPDCGLHNDGPIGLWIGSSVDLESLEISMDGFCDAGRDLLRHVDFDQEGVMLLGLGRRPTGGYGIRLLSSELEVIGDTLMLRFHLIQPGPDSRVTQALTWPCALIRVPKGKYRHIQAVDTEGQLVLKIRMDSGSGSP